MLKRNQYYNFDLIIAVGYRVNSKKVVELIKCANRVLKGYVINENKVVVSNEKYIEL